MENGGETFGEWRGKLLENGGETFGEWRGKLLEDGGGNFENGVKNFWRMMWKRGGGVINQPVLYLMSMAAFSHSASLIPASLFA